VSGAPERRFADALAKARADWAAADAAACAARAGCERTGAGVVVPLFGRPHLVTHPRGEVTAASGESAPAPVHVAVAILVLHYLLTADGTATADRWIAFRNLPGGLGYDAAFQARANLRLARAFGSERAAFEAAARALKGESLSFGDASFLFRMLPRLWLAVVLYLADDEFPANANVLFDAAASHYLPTEDLAVLGGLLAGRLIRLAHPR